MVRPPSLIISTEDFQNISALVAQERLDLLELLEEELGRANLVPPEQIPPDTVVMNSEVTFVDLDTGKEQRLRLVYPKDSDIEAGRISILAPIGSALIGLRIGQEIEWPVVDRKTRRIRVVGVSRPEDPK